MEFWKTRVDIQTRTLSGDKLQVALEEANHAIENIRREANANLSTLLKSSPIPVIGLPLWRKALLLYRPMEGNRILGYLERAFYLMNLWAVSIVVLLAVAITVYSDMPKQLRDAALVNYLHSRAGYAAGVSLFIYSLVISLNAIMCFVSVRRERKPAEIEEISQL